MNQKLGLVVALLTVFIGVLMLGLFLTKLIRHYNQRRVAFRSAVYISTLGEIVSRGLMPTRDLTAWAHDVAFHQTVIDFFGLVTGDERRTLVRLTHQLDMLRRFHRDLTSRRESERLRSVDALAVIAAPESRPFLVAALNDPVAEVRVGAAAGLSLIADGADTRPLLMALEKEDPWGAQRIADSIVRIGASAVPALSAYVLGGIDRNPEHLGIAIRCLGQLGDERAKPALLSVLRNVDPVLRLKAAAALAQPWGESTALLLIARLVDIDWRVRAQAANALAAYNSPLSIPHLITALQDEAWWVRQNAATALGRIEGGTEGLRQALELPDAFAVAAARSQLETNMSDWKPSTVIDIGRGLVTA